MVSKFTLGTAKSIETKEAISRTLEFANNYAGELSIEILPLNKIELDPENSRDLILTLQDAINGINKNDPQFERKKLEWKSLESLAKTIQDTQLINPIYVYRYGNKCRLIAGERRTLASAMAGKKEIIARISNERPIGAKLRILQWIENNERSELTLAERVASLESITQEYFSERKEKISKERLTAKLLSDLTGISGSQARRYILIFNAEDDIKRAIKEGKLENINLIELICSAKTEDQKSQLLAAALAGKPFNIVLKLKKELENENLRVVSKRRKNKTNVKLGSVKTQVAKVIIDSLLSNPNISPSISKQLNVINNSISWQDTSAIENGF
jgi:ParB family chromosome partitioning protein